MCNDTLKLRAAQRPQRAPGDGDRRIGGRIARSKGIDAVLLLEHIDLGHRNTRCDGHLLDHVAQPLQLRIPGVRIDHDTAEPARDRPAAVAQGEDPKEAGQPDGTRGQHGDPDEQREAFANRGGREHRRDTETVRIRAEPQEGERDQVDNGHDADDGEREEHQQEMRAPTGTVLMREEVQLNCVLRVHVGFSIG